MPVADPRKRLPSADRRQQILDTAATLFVQRGFEAVGMGDLAGALGTSRATVYSYFPSTESILDALLDERLHRLLTRLEPLLAHLPWQSPGAPGLIEPVFGFLLAERDTLALLHSGGGPSFRDRQTHFLSEVARRLPLDPAVPGHGHAGLLLIITTLLDALAYRVISTPALDAEALARTLGVFVRGGVLATLDAAQREGPADMTSSGPAPGTR
ncbi:TetR/AcrR family transcriptional regulator [Deinococcus multiflagellatus]|uniref:TetR/AcrR family transcriptional regulator n=1 Tax=Deinococcus multiflagellatus TaxID=1656887 RepID=A0ABW1ZSP5_9DEIO|nr:TetR/AcrR family transcriptional regulator [Deinococcus multiflagellatus]MBZ9713594.1 TetR/AcrR family transcriptional regulator [Deinococcus multiflagellatus]